MAKGEATWSSKGKKVSKGNFEPLPPGWYSGKLDSSAAEVRKAEGEGKFSRVSVRFRTPRDSGKDALVFHDFYTRTEPTEKGTVLVEMSGQVVQFANALGEEVNLPLATENGERILNPLKLAAWLKNRDGEVVKFRVRVEKDLNGDPRNRIVEFEEGEPVEEDEDDEDEKEPETDEAEDDAEDEDEEDEDEFEKATAAAKNKKAAGKNKRR